MTSFSPRCRDSSQRGSGFLFALVLLAACGSTLHAHMGSTSYLTLRIEGGELRGQWDMMLPDLDLEVELDRNADGKITSGEFGDRRREAEAYAVSNVVFTAEGVSLPLRFTDYLREEFTDGSYAVLRFVAPFPDGTHALRVTYRAFFEKDPLHRGLVRLETAGGGETSIFNPHSQAQEFQVGSVSRWHQFLKFIFEGTHHIWIGIDHMLFLVALLLPSVLRREGSEWSAVERFRPALLSVVKVVTAFTVAHSITLSLAALEIVQLPGRLVESTIAASVIVAAANNLRPMLPGRGWIVAFAFGLVHGFGFASVLTGLGLPRDAMALALVGFNVGVEVGQLALVALFLPAAFLFRRTPAYQRIILVGGSAVIVLVATAWMVERMTGTSMLPF